MTPPPRREMPTDAIDRVGRDQSHAELGHDEADRHVGRVRFDRHRGEDADDDDDTAERVQPGGESGSPHRHERRRHDRRDEDEERIRGIRQEDVGERRVAERLGDGRAPDHHSNRGRQTDRAEEEIGLPYPFTAHRGVVRARDEVEQRGRDARDQERGEDPVDEPQLLVGTELRLRHQSSEGHQQQQRRGLGGERPGGERGRLPGQAGARTPGRTGGLARASRIGFPLAAAIRPALIGSSRGAVVASGQRPSGDPADNCAIGHVARHDRAGADKRAFADRHARRHHDVRGDDGPGADGDGFEAVAVVVANHRVNVLSGVEHRVRPDEHPAATAEYLRDRPARRRS